MRRRVDSALEGDLLALAVREVTRRIAVTVAREAHAAEWTTCVADGCLVRNSEVCPACRLRVEARKARAAA